MGNKIQEGLESIERIKLLMGYSLDKTLTENKETILVEQVTSKDNTINTGTGTIRKYPNNPLINPTINTPKTNLGKQDIDKVAEDIAKALISALSQFNDDEGAALNQIMRINTPELLNKVNREVIRRSKMRLKDYIDDEMSNTFDPEYSKIMSHINSIQNKPSQINTKTKSIDIFSSPQGLSLTGPYAPNNVLYIDGEITIEPGGGGEGYYLIKNNTKSNLILKTVTSSYLKGKITPTFYTTPVKPGESTKIYLVIREYPFFDKSQSQSSLLQSLNSNLPKDNTINTGTGTIRKYPDNPFKQSKINPTIKSDLITVETNLGKLEFKVKYGYPRSYKKFIEGQENLQSGLSVPGGKKVPEGYSPFEYDEFLSKLKTLTQRCPNLKDTYNRLNEQSVIGAPNFGDTRSSFNPNEEEKKVFACNSEYQKLQSEYYNGKFPQGITKEDLVDYNKGEKDIDSKIEMFKKSHMFKEYDEDKLWFNYSRLSPSLKKEYDNLVKQKEDLEQYYGYDGRNMFDKFMDSGWGQLAQFGAIAVLAIAGFVTEGATWVLAADLIMNLGLGVYYTDRGNVREGLLFFIFAGMGRLHLIYDAVLGKVGRTIAGESLGAIGKSIATKLAGISLDSPAALNTFMYTVLTKSERKVFRAVLTQLKENPKSVQDALETLSKEVAQARGVYRDISFTNAMKLKPAAGKFIKNTFIDLAITIPAAQKGYDSLKSYLKSKGIDITWGERDGKLIEYLAENKTDSQIKNLYKVMNEIAKGLNKEESQYYQKELDKINKANEEEAKKELDKFVEMDEAETQEYIKKLQKEVLALEKKHKDVKQKLSTPEERQRIQDKIKNNLSKHSLNTTTTTSTLPISMSTKSKNDTLR